MNHRRTGGFLRETIALQKQNLLAQAGIKLVIHLTPMLLE